MENLKPGPFAMAITPFNRDGGLDEGAWRANLQRLGASGIGVYLASHQTGEGPLLTDEETFTLIEIAADELGGKVPLVCANLERVNAVTNIEFIREASARGIETAQLYPPVVRHYMLKPNTRELLQHYRDVLSEITTPVVISSNEASGYVVAAEVHATLLAEFPQIVGFNKYNRPDDITDFVETVSPKPVYTGWADQAFLSFLLLGGAGSLDHGVNIAPRLYRAFFDAFDARDMDTAIEHYTTIMRLHRSLALVDDGSITPGAVKSAMRVLGLPGGYRRRPFIDPEFPAEQTAGFKRVMDELGITEIEGL